MSNPIKSIQDYVAASQLVTEAYKLPFDFEDDSHEFSDEYYNFIRDLGVYWLDECMTEFAKEMSRGLEGIFEPREAEKLASSIFGMLTGENTEQQIYLRMLYDAFCYLWEWDIPF